MPILYVQVGRKDGRARRHIATLELPTFKLPTLCEMVSRFFFFYDLLQDCTGKSGQFACIRYFYLSPKNYLREYLKISVC